MSKTALPLPRGEANKVNILSLPDETISLIFRHLDAFDTTGCFRRPRHAFLLALTNTRFLCIFCEQMTRITPKLTDQILPTVSPKHLISIIRLIGRNLRELHLPRGCVLSILQQIVDLCPRLEKLVIVEIYSKPHTRETFEKLLALPIRSLTIRFPTSVSLQVLGLKIPEELCLTFISLDHIPLILQILRGVPPKRLSLEFERGALDHSDELLPLLHEVCPQTEELSVTALRIIEFLPDPPFFPEAKRLLQKSCQNINSKCLRMSLEGNVMTLLALAHPKATVEISRGTFRGKTTYIRNEKGIFPKRIDVSTKWIVSKTQNFPLNQDLLEIKEICFDAEINSLWKELLPSLRLEKVWINAYRSNKVFEIRLHADTVYIDAGVLDGRTAWDCLFYVKKVEIMDHYFQCFVGKKPKEFFSSLLCLIEQFRGKELWIDICEDISISHEDKQMRNLFRNIRRMLDEFESHGGEAGTVREQVNCIEWT